MDDQENPRPRSVLRRYGAVIAVAAAAMALGAGAIALATGGGGNGGATVQQGSAPIEAANATTLDSDAGGAVVASPTADPTDPLAASGDCPNHSRGSGGSGTSPNGSTPSTTTPSTTTSDTTLGF
jgi:hypothetical protein